MSKPYARVSASPALSWAFRQLPFWDRVNAQIQVNEHGCHVFTGSKDECGYGRIRHPSGKLVRLHRAVWEREHGVIEAGKVICHACDNPACINLSHLFIGSQADNIRDMESKGRRRTLVGTQRSTAKLKEEQIPVIRGFLAQGRTCEELGRMYQVSAELIRHIKKGRIWRHV
jgi:hypothetical protein